MKGNFDLFPVDFGADPGFLLQALHIRDTKSYLCRPLDWRPGISHLILVSVEADDTKSTWEIVDSARFFQSIFRGVIGRHCDCLV